MCRHVYIKGLRATSLANVCVCEREVLGRYFSLFLACSAGRSFPLRPINMHTRATPDKIMELSRAPARQQRLFFFFSLPLVRARLCVLSLSLFRSLTCAPATSNSLSLSLLSSYNPFVSLSASFTLILLTCFLLYSLSLSLSLSQFFPLYFSMFFDFFLLYPLYHSFRVLLLLILFSIYFSLRIYTHL